MKQAPSTLYHYCSVENMFNIFNSKALWLSNSSQMNDSKESTWIEQYFEVLKNTFAGKEYEKFVDQTLTIYEWNKYKPFIFCLSAKKDSLSQWRAYSSDGKGVCIGLSSKSLKLPRNVPSPNVNADNTIGLLPIEYIINNQKKGIVEVVSHFKKIYDEKKEKFWELSSTFLGLALAKMSLTYKNPSFSEEKEWRIVHTPAISVYEVESETEKRMSNLNFRIANEKIMTFYKYKLDDIFNSDLIKEIVLGPKSNIDLPELEQFLKFHELDKTKISISESTYR